VNVLSAFWIELRRVRTSLQAYSKWKLAKVVVKLWGGVRHCGEMVKDLALYSGSSLLLRFCLE